ncbi:colanic acid biosynthesis acetyltransferase WcaF [Formosa sediminum]|uniref:Colanic acid biosynthesis acetyltransferase WcaF n=1 Tax=Formosa sediminum TaxID=2594004 RepID=A0A516GQ99_9FLAO|nr:WcaF family extracellular polysaccharide biosynthesis acetyltransferase [Formosa sediminum]QDO93704.1 colanic acid biosynthesis acetyltransferase WcaF [Formosa sediminum]
MKTDLSTYNNAWYQPGGKLKRLCWYFINVLFFINPLNPSSGLKVSLLRFFGAKIGSGVVIKPGVNIKYPWLLIVGDYTWIGENVWIDNLAQVTIGNHVCISQEAMLLCGNHNYKKTTFDLMLGEIILEEGAWVGAKSVVCPDVKIESHAILTVNSVATNTLKANYIYQGNPAKEIRKREIK